METELLSFEIWIRNLNLILGRVADVSIALAQVSVHQADIIDLQLEDMRWNCYVIQFIENICCHASMACK
jgi:hypothetical protein